MTLFRNCWRYSRRETQEVRIAFATVIPPTNLEMLALHYRGRPVSEITPFMKVSAIVRICRMLTLGKPRDCVREHCLRTVMISVGENLGGPEMKDKVLAVFQRANERKSMRHPRYEPSVFSSRFLLLWVPLT